MLFSLARGSYLPDSLGRLNRNGVPGPALAVSSAGMVAAILLAVFSPGKAFLLLYGVAVAGMFFVWLIILATHLRFRRALGSARVAALPMRLPFFPVSTVLGGLALIAIAFGTFYVDGLQYTIPEFLSFLVVISIVYVKTRRRIRAAEAQAA
jgi:L-asparagine transporter-like permease